VTQHLALNVNQSNDINNDPWLCTWIWMLANQITLTISKSGAESRIIVHVIWLVGIQSQVQSQGSLLMSFDWLALKSRCRVTDHCSCHLIGWHSNPGAESWIIVHNDPWLCTWIWMSTNQMTLTMIRDSAPDFECQPIKWHEQWSVTLHLTLNANQSNDINNDPWLCTWLWMPTNQMTWTMIHDSAPDFECQIIKWHE
jgi:hypothetical protein